MEKKFKVDIALAVGMSKDVHCYQIQIEAGSKEAVFKRITANPWFHHIRTITRNDGTEEISIYIQVKHITDIYIQEI